MEVMKKFKIGLNWSMKLGTNVANRLRFKNLMLANFLKEITSNFIFWYFTRKKISSNNILIVHCSCTNIITLSLFFCFILVKLFIILNCRAVSIQSPDCDLNSRSSNLLVHVFSWFLKIGFLNLPLLLQHLQFIICKYKQLPKYNLQWSVAALQHQ